MGTSYTPSEWQQCQADYVRDCERANCEPLWEHEVFVTSFAYTEQWFDEYGGEVHYHSEWFDKEA